MKRNAFIANRSGEVFPFEPDFNSRPISHDTILFRDALEDVTAAGGGAVCLSALISVDALLGLLQVIQGELTARVESENANMEAPPRKTPNQEQG